MEIYSNKSFYKVTLFSGLVSSLFLMLFGILNLQSDNKISGMIEICFSIILILFNITLIKSKRIESLSHHILIVALIFFTFELFSGGYDKSALFWFYYYPIICYTLKGRRIGLYYNLSLILIMLLAYIIWKIKIIHFPYQESHFIVFYLSFIGLSIFLFWVAYLRETTKDKIKEELYEIKKLNKQLEYLSSYDSLTSIFNRRQIIQILENEISRFERFNKSFSILLLDVDHFKNVNDEYGHLFGDKALIELTHLIQKKILRSIDNMGRYGGEEFLIILPGTDKFGGIIASERIRNSISEFPFFNDELKIDVNITVSIGVSSIAKGDDINSLLRKADIALYRAKETGRNKVEVYIEDEINEGEKKLSR